MIPVWQLHAYGASVATAAVATAAAQKVLNSHVQQIGGLTSLQVDQRPLHFHQLHFQPLSALLLLGLT